MSRRPSAPSSVSSPALAGLLAGALVLGLAACGGKGKGPAPVGNGGGGSGGGLATRLPWEAALTEGASFTLANEMPEGEGDETVTVKVTAVEEDGGARVYRLDWGEEGANGPTTIRVEGGQVTINDAKPEAMQEPYSPPGGLTCYGEDFSNPEGCEDICDASLCLSSGGIERVDGLYAPGYGMFARK